ncbi:hypothetical protein WMY93_029431 [Mugilogobius chulae]|uniref:mRNA decay activator protein ZFP36 n=1 Tax=Mugilogobius chulae TaxID=88201 RepID=A0AAW0MVU6_9GOBI
MPSYSLSQFTDLEEIMCKQLLGLDLREQNRPLSMAMKTPGYIGQRSNSSFSLSSLCPSSESSENMFPSPSQWRPSPESPLSPQLPNTTHWGRAGFLAQRSISMVETNSMAAASLCWSGSDLKLSQSDLSTAALSNSSLSASSSSSSRYKTELCRSFTENGLCKYGSKCQFAHGMDELRDLNRHPKYKTEPCRTFHTIGFCPYGIRCHFVHNNEEERKSISRSSSSSSSSSTGVPAQAPSTRPNRPPLVRHSFSFAGFPSVPQQSLQPPHAPNPASAFTRAPSPSPPACADITDLLSQAFLELDSAFEASPAHLQFQPPQSQTTAGEPRSPFLPSPDSGCSSPTLRQSPGASGVFGPLGTRSLSYTSLSDQDQDAGSSSSSLSGSEPCCGLNEANGKRLAVFSQLSVPDDPAAFFI